MSFSPGGMAITSFRSAGSPRCHFSRIDAAVSEASGRLAERCRRVEHEPQQALLKRHRGGKIGRICSDFGPLCRGEAP